jgi:Na+/H+ antiporter NhaD/arsenite permease-like protein
MASVVVFVFALTYFGMALGRIPGLRVDRSGIAMIAAVVLVVLGAVPTDEIVKAIHFPTLLLMGGLMILSARFGAAGLYNAAAAWIATQARRPFRLLALTIFISGVLSAFLINDIVVFAMTPLLCAGVAGRGLDTRPFLFGLAAGSNVGSAATLIGNPQNILIGQVGRLDFWNYLVTAMPATSISLVITFACIAWGWRSALRVQAIGTPTSLSCFDRRQATISGLALFALLVLFTTRLPREISAVLVAAFLIVSRTVPSRQLLDEIDLPLLILFASLFIVNDALARTGVAQEVMRSAVSNGWLPDRISLLAPMTLLLSNTIGNVPAVVMLLAVWHDIPSGVLIGLAVLSTLAGNLFLVGSLANLIVVERALIAGVRLSFYDHAKVGVPITVLSMLSAGLWLWMVGVMVL